MFKINNENLPMAWFIAISCSPFYEEVSAASKSEWRADLLKIQKA